MKAVLVTQRVFNATMAVYRNHIGRLPDKHADLDDALDELDAAIEAAINKDALGSEKRSECKE